MVRKRTLALKFVTRAIYKQIFTLDMIGGCLSDELLRLNNKISLDAEMHRLNTFCILSRKDFLPAN